MNSIGAKGDNRILLSDDLPFRVLATEAASIQGVWSQASASYAGSIRKLTTDDYFQVGNALAEAKYFFTTLNIGNFLHALKKSNWAVTPMLKKMIDLLARPANEPQGVLSVLCDLAKLGWPLKPDVESYEALFTAIFIAFKKAQPDRDLELIANIVFGSVQEFLRSRFIPQFRDQLLQSTFMKGGAAIADEVRQIHRGLIAQIGQALGRAIEKARGGLSQTPYVPCRLCGTS